MSSILTEIGNIVLNGVLGSLANFLETNLSYTVPYFFGERDHSTLGFLTSSWALKPGSNLLIADAHFRVRQQGIQGWLLIFFDREVLTHVLQAVTVSGPASR
jgi:chemotaxis protein CheC